MPVPLYSFEAEAASVLESIRLPWWRKDAHDISRLVADFRVKDAVDISLDVRLRSGHLLSSYSAQTARESILDFLCLQGARSLPKSGAAAGRTDRSKFITACRVIDGLLIRDKAATLARFGLKAITGSDLIAVLLAAGANAKANIGIYDWHARLANLLRSKIDNLTPSEVRRWTTKYPEVGEHAQSGARYLQLDDKEIVLSRVFILSEAERLFGPFQIMCARKSNGVLRTMKESMYADTLLGRSELTKHLTFPEELILAKRDFYRREFAAVPVSCSLEEESASRQTIEKYRKSIVSGAALAKLANSFPLSAIEAVTRADISAATSLKGPFGFRHVPPHIVATSLAAAIDFFYSKSDDIFSCIELLALERIDFSTLSSERVPPSLRAIGVDKWTIPATVSDTEYAAILRTSPGLWNILSVLYGACAIIVGTLEALRKGEVNDIKKGDIDATSDYLQVISRKSGFGDIRRIDELPLPKVAFDVLSRLRTFVERIDPQHTMLFAILGKKGKFHNSSDRLESCIDAFLDYIESPKDRHGRRYYLRQHQLRKFFIEVFFRCCGFAGMDTLRWFVRHLDLQHIWAYIKLTTSKEELRQHMSDAAVPLIRAGDSHMDGLISFLNSRYGASDLKVLSNEEFSMLLTDLQTEHRIEFELVFSEDGNEESLHLGVVIWEARNVDNK